MDQSNPAVEQQMHLSPAILAMLDEDKTILPTTARKMLFVQMSELHKRFKDVNAPIGQRQAFADFLAKIADAYPKTNAPAVAPGSGFSVNIIMGSKAEPPRVQDITDVSDIKLVNTNNEETPSPNV